MTRVDPAQSRIEILDTGSGLDITIPAKIKWFLVVFLSFWLVGWAVGAVSAVTQLMIGKTNGSSTVFMIGWLGAWLGGGAAAMLFVLWMLIGREIVRVTASEIQYVRKIGVLSLTREYEVAHVERLRVTPQPLLAGYVGFFGSGFLSDGRIAFDYGASTVRFGRDLDEGEARPIVDAIRRRFRHLGD